IGPARKWELNPKAEARIERSEMRDPVPAVAALQPGYDSRASESPPNKTKLETAMISRGAVTVAPSPPRNARASPGCRCAPAGLRHCALLFPLFSIVISIVRHCSCAGGFSAARPGPCIVIRSHFALQIDCIFLGHPSYGRNLVTA